MNYNLVQNGYGFKKGYIPWNKGGESIVKKCLVCSEDFEVFYYRKDAKYCSFVCSGRSGKGRKRTKEAIENISMAKQGENNPMWGVGGEEHYNWKGGITPETKKIRNSFEYKQWRSKVFERDNYTCLECGIKNGSGKTVILNADHIKPFALFPNLRFEILNGRTLCESCHKNTQTYGGGYIYAN